MTEHSVNWGKAGPPPEVYESPADAYVADFLGAANPLQIVVTERVGGGASLLKLGDIALTTSNEVPAEPGPVSAGTVAQAVIRPEPAPADAEAAVAS